MIELHIDELVLRGFRAGDRFRIAEALQNELTRLFSDRTASKVAPHSITVERVNAGTFRVAPFAGPAAVGTQLGQSIYRQIAPVARGSLPEKP